MRTLAIGDIHGCATALDALLTSVGLRPDDKVVFLGDYIDRGPNSRGVIEKLIKLGQSHSAVFLRGNHEAMILEARSDASQAHLWQSCGGQETVFSYGANFRNDWASFIPDSHWKFFEETVNYLETDSHIFVHGCLEPDLEMRDQPASTLHWERFEDLKPHKSGKRVICGHTPQRFGAIKDVGYAVCIDTAPATGGWLTCMDTASGQFWQANEKGQTRSGEIKV